MNMPTHLRNPKILLETQEMGWRLENKLKNVVVRRLDEIRAIKAKPSLKDMLDVYFDNKDQKDERSRVRIKE